MKIENYYINKLAGKYSLAEARIMARLLVCHTLSVSLNELLTRDISLSDSQKSLIDKAVARLLTGEPIQYVICETEFCGFVFKTDRRALIPRPETEELVMKTLDICSTFPSPEILDIGTGTGAIAISLALKLRHAHLTALDISSDALSLAKENAGRLNANVDFIQADILALQDFDHKFHIIVSNPPYIRLSEQRDMESNVLDYEPHGALFVPDADPLLFYRAIAEFGKRHLFPNGFICFEINQYLPLETMALLTRMGYVDVTLYRDINDNPRIVTARFASNF